MKVLFDRIADSEDGFDFDLRVTILDYTHFVEGMPFKQLRFTYGLPNTREKLDLAEFIIRNIKPEDQR